jgi:hypothetical protein
MRRSHRWANRCRGRRIKLRVLLTMLKEQRLVTERRRRLQARGARRRTCRGARPPTEPRPVRRAKLDAMIVYAQTALCRWKPCWKLGEAVDWGSAAAATIAGDSELARATAV